MLLTMGNIDMDTICLICQWRSEDMLLYLHVTLLPLTKNCATIMVFMGYYTLITTMLTITDTPLMELYELYWNSPG